jgi:hypothetical protein
MRNVAGHEHKMNVDVVGKHLDWNGRESGWVEGEV